MGFAGPGRRPWAGRSNRDKVPKKAGAGSLSDGGAPPYYRGGMCGRSMFVPAWGCESQAWIGWMT